MSEPTIVGDEPIIEFSEPFDLFAEAFVAAQPEVLAIIASETAKVKHREGGGEHSYKYADLNALLEAIRPAYAKHGLAVMQGPRTRGKFVDVQTYLLHKSSQWGRTKLTMESMGNTPQALGSTITYARRYSLLAMCGVAPEDDDGKAGSTKVATAGSDPRPVLEGITRLVELIATRQIEGALIAESWQELVEGQSISVEPGGDLEALRALYGVLRRRAMAKASANQDAAPAAAQTQEAATDTDSDGSAEDVSADTTSSSDVQKISEKSVQSEMHQFVRDKLASWQVADDDALVLEIVAEVSSRLCDRTTYSWAHLPEKALREFFREFNTRRKQTAGAA